MDNTSGQGKGAVLPDGIKGWGWGPFVWTFIWGLFNRVWLSFLVFIPVIGFIFAFVLGFKGREWAWQNKTWESVEHFNRVQRKWTIAGLVLFGLIFLLTLAAFFMGLVGEDPPAPAQAQLKPPASTPVPKPAAPKPAPAPPPMAKPAPAEEMPKETKAPATAESPAPAKAPMVASAARTGASAPAPRPRVRREAQPQPIPAAAAPAPEPKVYTPKYNDLMTAVLKPDREAVTELLDLGRWIDKPDGTGVTPLQAAVRNRDTQMTELLLKRGANVNASASDGITALKIARANGDAAMAALLQRAGAR